MAVSDRGDWWPGGQYAEVAGAGGLRPELLEFVVLGGEPRQREGLELGELSDGSFAAGQSLPEFLGLLFEAGDLGIARVGDLARSACLGEAPFEVLLQMRVGPVERGT